MERKEAIRSAYRLTGDNNFYDGMITCSTLSGKAAATNGMITRWMLHLTKTASPSIMNLRRVRRPMRLYHLRRSRPVW